MELIPLGLAILVIGLLVVIAQRVFWLLSIFIFYRVTASFLTFEWAQAQLGVESHFLYFLVILAVSFFLHYVLVVRLMSELGFLKIPFYIALTIWLFYYYDFLELFLLKDWLVANNLWGWESIQTSLKDLFSTPGDELKAYFAESLTKMANSLWGIVETLFGDRIKRPD